jgi:hypothetical protein
MGDWLTALLDDRRFDLIGAPIISFSLAAWLVYDFFKTRRAVKRGEPLRVWYLRYPVYPDDLKYSYFAWQREYPAILLFVFVGLGILGFVGLVIWVTFWPPHS